jgi:carboxyl-terminal processing protease
VIQKRAVSVVIALIITLVATTCGLQFSPSPTPISTPKLTTAIESRLTAAERLAILDAVWQTVNDGYFDPTFGGKDWQAIGDEYRQKLATVQDDQDFWFGVLNPMLFELGVSHLVALPAELSNQLDPITFATGSLGLDVRWLDSKAVVTRVVGGSPAEKSGLRPGFVITAVDGKTVEELAANSLQVPPYNERNRRGEAVKSLRAFLYGETGQQVVYDYLDADDQPQQAAMQYAKRNSTCEQIDPSLPPTCAEIEVKHLAEGIGYLRFSGFLPPILGVTLQAIDDMHELPALIIDLRGNPGGVFPVRKAIASQLVGEPRIFMRYQQRDELLETNLDPVKNAYTGEVVLLVDELSASSSEEFAGSLQSMGRVTIIGTQTPGRCLVMNVEQLPNEAILVYPYGQSQTPDGRVLEDNGVVPDIEVALDREQLLQGSDAQLQTAIEYLLAEQGKN